MKRRWIALVAIVAMLTNGLLPIQAAESTTETLLTTDALYIRGGDRKNEEMSNDVLVDDYRYYYDSAFGATRIPYLRFDMAEYMDVLDDIESITLCLTSNSDGTVNLGTRTYNVYLLPQASEAWWTATDGGGKRQPRTWNTAVEYGLPEESGQLLATSTVELATEYTMISGNLLEGIKDHLKTNTDDTVITLRYELVSDPITSSVSICYGKNGNELQQPALNITYSVTDEHIVKSDVEALTFDRISTETADSVTKDLMLPKTGANGSTITWTEESGRINTETGKVTRPAYGEENVEVTLKAAVSYGDASQEVTFTLTILADDGMLREVKSLSPTNALYIRGDVYKNTEYTGQTLVNDIRPGYDGTSGQTRVPYLRFDMAEYMDVLDDMENITLRLTTTAADVAAGNVNLGERNFKIYLMPQAVEDWWTNAASKTWTTAEQYGIAGNTSNQIAGSVVTLEGNDVLESGNLFTGIQAYLEANPGETAITLMYELSGVNNISICNGLNAEEALRPVLNITYRSMDLTTVMMDVETLTFDKLSTEPKDSITKDLTLPKIGENGSTITWIEESGRINTETGAVTRPEQNDVEITLKALVSYGSAAHEVAFTFTVLADDGMLRETTTLSPTDALYIRGREHKDTEYIGDILVNDIRPGYDGANGQTRVPYLRFVFPEDRNVLENMQRVTLRLTTTAADVAAGNVNLGERNFKIYLMPQSVEEWWTNAASKTWTTAEQYGIAGNTSNLIGETVVTLEGNDVLESSNLLVGIKKYLEENPGETAITLMYELSGENNISICNGLNAEESLRPVLNIVYSDTGMSTVLKDVEALTFDKLSTEPADSVTKNLILPKTGENGSVISWTEDSGRINTETGVVTRPSYGEGNVKVTLKALVSYGIASQEVIFTLTILADDGIRQEKTTLLTTDALYIRGGDRKDEEASNGLLVDDSRYHYDSESGATRIPYLRFDMAEYMDVLDDIESITLRLTSSTDNTANLETRTYNVYLLPQDSEAWWTVKDESGNQQARTWNTAAEYGLPGDGGRFLAGTTVELTPEYTMISGNLLEGIKDHLKTNTDDTIITLRYELVSENISDSVSVCYGKNGNESQQPALNITYAVTDEYYVRRDVKALTFDKLSTEPENSVTANLTLPKTGEYGSTITWTADSNRIDTETGEVTRPGVGEENAEVTLKAVISYGEASQEVTFTLTILADEGIPYATETILATDALYIRAREFSETEFAGVDLVDDVRYNYDSNQGATRVPYLRFNLAECMDVLDDITNIELRLTTKGTEYHTGTRTYRVYLMPQDSEAWWTATDSDGNPLGKTWSTAEEYNLPGNKEHLLAESTVTLSPEGTIVSGNLLEGIKDHLNTYPQDTIITLMYELAGGENLSICYGTNANEMLQPALNITYHDMNAYDVQRDAMALTFDKLSTERQDSVSKTLYLPTAGENGSTITWSVVGDAINVQTGAVNRPAYGEADASVTLTATVTKEDAIKIVTLPVTVLADRADPIFAGKTVPSSDSAYVRSDSAHEGFVTEHLLVGTENGVHSAAFVKIDCADSLALIENTNALYLRLMPDGGTHTGPVHIYGIDTDWTGETLTYEMAQQKGLFDGELLSSYNGVLNANTYVDTENLTEYVHRQLAAGNQTLAFRLETEGGQYTVHSAEASIDLMPMLIMVDNQDAVQATLEDLTLQAITTEDPAYIRKDLILPQEGRYETTITWSAAPTGIVASDGTITRPIEDTTVILTATVSSGNISGQKSFQLVVRRQETPEQYIDWLFDQITFPLSILTEDITLPTISGTQIAWSSADPYEMAVDGDTLHITRPKSSDLSTKLTGQISYNGTIGTRDFPFVILRDVRNDILYGSSVTSEDKMASNALDDNLTTSWETAGGQTLTLDLNMPRTFATLMIIPSGTGFSGLDAEISADGYVWKTIYSGGSFQVDQINTIVLDTPAYGRYVRFTFPSGNYGIRMLSGYVEGSTESDQTLASITLPTTVTADFALPSSIGGEKISWTSGNTSAIRIDGETAVVTRSSVDITVTLTAQTASEKRLFHVVVKQLTTNAGNGGSSGGSGGSGTITNHVVAPPVDHSGISSPGISTPETEKIPAYFNDLDSVPWAVDYINTLAERGIVNGIAEGKYAPNDSLKREEFAKLITEALGLEKLPAESLSDVESDSWYNVYVGAVCGAGISNGIGAGLFGTGMDITRQDAMCQLARALGARGFRTGEFEPFADDESIAEYAREGIYLLRSLGIIDGDENNCVNPDENISRAEIAKIIYLTMELLAQ